METRKDCFNSLLLPGRLHKSTETAKPYRNRWMKYMEKLLTDAYYSKWFSLLHVNLENEFEKIKTREWTAEHFKFATAVSVMSSSKIEGETLEIDSYIKHKMLAVEYLSNLTEKPNDLYAAYEFAKDHSLSIEHLNTVHSIATRHLLHEQQRGQVRTGNMLIVEQQSQRVQYEAASAQLVQKEYDRLWNELNNLIDLNLNVSETFYYASLIHLVFVKIHPFYDGNGRTARLLEKWFLYSKLGEKAWYVPSELHYYNNLKSYYHNLARVGLLYEELKYERGVPFLLMLPQSLIFEK
jgi:Fic family protein